MKFLVHLLGHLVRIIEGFYNFIYRLFFTRDDDLDVLQLLFAILLVVTMRVAWVLTTSPDMSDEVRIQGLIELRWLIALLVVTAVPKWLVPSIVSILSGRGLKDTVGDDGRHRGGGGGYGGYGGYPPDPYGMPYSGQPSIGADGQPIVEAQPGGEMPGIPTVPAIQDGGNS